MASSGEPIAIEGEVCCGGTGEGIAFMSDGLGNQNETAIPVNTTDRDVYTRQECQDNGGAVVGDIGDGSIFQPDYICEISGQPPVADIVQTEEPFAIEGEVCCGPGIVPISDGLGDQNDTAIVNATDRDVYTRQECIDNDGLVVGDIGDGSIFQPDYICESSGEVPLANIVQTGEALAMEGEVCCGQEAVPITDVGRNSVTRQECTDQGGDVVGDIGDGATQEEGYVCESNGEEPLGNIITGEGEPIASEGEVCCGPPKDSASSSPFVSLGFFSALLVWNLA
jgi:hypothetical protein